MNVKFIASLFLIVFIPSTYQSYGTKTSDGHYNDNMDVSAEGDAVNHPGIDGTSKACRYDDGPGWSDCDPFELIRFKVLKLVHGGSQCEVMKNITKHCTPHDFPFGTHWLIQEHRKCIAELNRLKSMISDLHKFIETLHTKGKELFGAYQKLKKKLDDLKVTLEKMKADGEHSQEVLKHLKEEVEEWRAKARDLQVELDEIRSKYHDLQNEDHELQLKNTQMKSDINVIQKENEGMEQRIEKIILENDDLKKRILEYEHIKEKLGERRQTKAKLENKVDRLEEYLNKIKDDLAEQRINNLKNNIPDEEDNEIESKDTHVDLSMEMYIVHNKTTLYKPTHEPIIYTTEKPKYKKVEQQAKCLISYYGYTNETCWYESEGEESEDNYVDALGHHLVEAHWKYFTIDVSDQAECDKAAHLHYEFLINRCSPKHFLPVMSVYRPTVGSKKLGTHFYPKMNVPSGQNTCWITFLGAHGHCEAHSKKYDLYNTDDTEEGYAQGSGTSAEKCLARADWWMKFCDTPVLATYVPGGVSSSWNNHWIMHDSHGGRMFEEVEDALNHINPDSMDPHQADPSKYNSEFKSMSDKSLDYHDSPEFRKSLHLQGEEKEKVLQKLRQKLGMSGRASEVMEEVKTHKGVDTGETNQINSYSADSQQYEVPKDENPKIEEPKYEEPKYEEPKEEPKYEEPKYEEPKYEEPKYEEPKYEDSNGQKYDEGIQEEAQEEPDSFKDTII